MSYPTKLSRFSSLIAFAACGAILAVITREPALARPTSPSSYASSCENIQINGATLSARCRLINGKTKSTSILIRGIDNQNGNLTYSRNPRAASSYHLSCRNIDNAGATLLARCRLTNGKTKSTSILIRGIDNQDGNLTYSR
jgi:CVNH domain